MAFVVLPAALRGRHASRSVHAVSPAGVRHYRVARTRMTATQPEVSPASVLPTPFEWPSSNSDDAASQPGGFQWLENWYPVAWEADVPAERPVAVTIFSRNYVLFRDPLTGFYVVMDDACPHRAAPLSEGRLFQREVDGKKETILECNYHGWRFDCEGTCVDIPTVDLARAIPKAANVGGVYATSVALGLIFVWLGDRAKADEALIPMPKQLMEMDPSQLTIFRDMKRDFPISYSTVMENVADPGHVNWAHHGSGQGNRTRTKRDMRVPVLENRPENGFFLTALHPADAERPALKYWFQAPVSVGYDAVFPIGKDAGLNLLTWVVPMDHGKCSMFAVHIIRNVPVVKFLSRFKPRWYEHSLGNLILDGDAAVLQWQEKHLQDISRDGHGGAWKQEYNLAAGQWDELVVRFRTWLDANAETMPFVSERPKTPLERVPIEDVLDRYKWHTKDCGCCAAALRNFRWARVGALVLALVGGLTAILSGLVLISLQGTELAFSMKPLLVAGVSGVAGCLLMLLCAAVCTHFIQLLTYTTVAYDLNHAPSE